MLKALGRLMNSVGLRVEKFNDPIDFLGRLKHAQCHLAVIDISMPHLSGLEVQARLRQDSPETRIIFMTGQDSPSAHQSAFDAGAFAFLRKPFEDETLVQLVRKAFGYLNVSGAK